MIIKNCIVNLGLGNIPPDLTSTNLELARIPAEHQMKFFVITTNFWLPKTSGMLLIGIGIKLTYLSNRHLDPKWSILTSFRAHY